MVRTRGTFPSSSKSSFIPAILLDNERPGYRKGRAAYGCQRPATGALDTSRAIFVADHCPLAPCELPLIAGIAVNRQSMISACRSELGLHRRAAKIINFIRFICSLARKSIRF
jgi:hypothetical protein